MAMLFFFCFFLLLFLIFCLALLYYKAIVDLFPLGRGELGGYTNLVLLSILLSL